MGLLPRSEVGMILAIIHMVSAVVVPLVLLVPLVPLVPLVLLVPPSRSRSSRSKIGIPGRGIRWFYHQTCSSQA